MLTIKQWDKLSLSDRKLCLQRPAQAIEDETNRQVAAIINEVRTFGDEALLRFTQQFDGATLSSLVVSAEQIATATINDKAMAALLSAIATITHYHQELLPQSIQVNTANGVMIERLFRPISRVGLYVPGGNNTPLVSSLLMQAIPALVAGCPQRVLCTPPNAQGEIDPHLLVAARLCQIDTIYKLGGAQAIAAMAYGSQTIRKVDKIFGPGNRYVTAAKTQVSIDAQGTAIDMPAGPSEVMVIADNDANPAYVAADLLAQAEHGVDSQVILVCESVAFAETVNCAMNLQFNSLNRQAIIKQALAHSMILVCSDMNETKAIINNYAAEHLIINRADLSGWVDDITNAGTIFLGPWAAETMGDYVTGSNHVLPTNGFARNHSGLSSSDFLKAISVQSISRNGIRSLGDAAYTLAMIEGLDGHANAIKQRLLSAEVA